jgi:hypothetical protein
MNDDYLFSFFDFYFHFLYYFADMFFVLIYCHYSLLFFHWVLVMASLEILVRGFFGQVRSYSVYISNVYAMHSLKFPILHNLNQELHKDGFKKAKYLHLLYF